MHGENGVEILIHVGIDTVNLNGEFYDLLVKDNQYVHIGETLINFDRQSIIDKGYGVTTPVIVTNPSEHESFAKTIQKEVQEKDYFFR